MAFVRRAKTAMTALRRNATVAIRSVLITKTEMETVKVKLVRWAVVIQPIARADFRAMSLKMTKVIRQEPSVPQPCV